MTNVRRAIELALVALLLAVVVLIAALTIVLALIEDGRLAGDRGSPPAVEAPEVAGG